MMFLQTFSHFSHTLPHTSVGLIAVGFLLFFRLKNFDPCDHYAACCVPLSFERTFKKNSDKGHFHLSKLTGDIKSPKAGGLWASQGIRQSHGHPFCSSGS